MSGFSIRFLNSVKRPCDSPFSIAPYSTASSFSTSCTPTTVLPVLSYASISCFMHGTSFTTTSSPKSTAKGSSPTKFFVSNIAPPVPFRVSCVIKVILIFLRSALSSGVSFSAGVKYLSIASLPRLTIIATSSMPLSAHSSTM